MSTPPAVEKELQRVRRLPENRICPNCGKSDGNFGFQAVCMAFKTFVCSDCKSAHQAYSHRCKSVSMSIWSMLEVQSLEEKNDGGNKVAIRKWLTAPDSDKPSPESHIDMKKRFVDRAYNKKEWEGRGGSAPEPAPQSSPAPRAAPSQARSPTANRGAPPQPTAASKPAPAPTMDLLDMDGPSSSPAPAANSTTSCSLLDGFSSDPAPAPQAGGSLLDIGGGMGGSAFSFIGSQASSAPAAAPSAAPTPASADNTGLGGSAFSFISQGAPAQPSNQVSFDPLGMAMPATPAVPQQPAVSSFNTGMSTPMPMSNGNNQGMAGGMGGMGMGFQQQHQQMPLMMQQPMMQQPMMQQQGMGCGSMGTMGPMGNMGNMGNMGYGGQMMNSFNNGMGGGGQMPYMQQAGMMSQPPWCGQPSLPGAQPNGMTAAPVMPGGTSNMFGLPASPQSMATPASKAPAVSGESFDPFAPVAC